MFGLSALYTKLILSAAVLALVAGGYFYVTGLQHKVEKLQANITVLANENDSLKTTIEDQNKFAEKVGRVDELGNAERKANGERRDQQLKRVDEKVRQGKDRPVGPLLKEFFNEG